MATVYVETTVNVPAQRVWEAVADVGAVHRRLLPGRVADARIEGDVRILTMPDGAQVRELILAVDHGIRRMAYTVTEGATAATDLPPRSVPGVRGGRSQPARLADRRPPTCHGHCGQTPR